MGCRRALLACCLAALSSPGCAMRLTEPTLTDVPDWLLDIMASDFPEMRSNNKQPLSDGRSPLSGHPLITTSCPLADKPTLSAFKAIFSDWQGKSIAIAGDSLTDTVLESLLCSANQLGANDTLKESRTYYVGQGNSTMSYDNEQPLKIARELLQMSFVEHEITLPGLRPVTVAHKRFFDFDDGIAVHGFPIFMIKWSTLFDGMSFDAMFMNMAHSAMFYAANETETLVSHAIREAAARGHRIKKFVLFGHPPQHFDTPNGGWDTSGTATQRKCQCRPNSQLMSQAIWANNAAATRVAQQLKVPFVDPWNDFAARCQDHRPSDIADYHDCTHYSVNLNLHKKFLKRLFDAART